MEKQLEIRVLSPPIEDNYKYDCKQLSEPEVEENCDDSQMKELFESIGIDFERASNLKSVVHVPPSETCLHCKLEDKIKNLRFGIEKLNEEIEVSQEILKTKRIQNEDIRGIIERLEGTIGTTSNSDETKVETSDKGCSCAKTCLII